MKITLIKQGNTLIPHSEADFEILESLSNAIYTVDIKNLDTRTLQQNRAIHLWCKMIAEELNKNGLYLQSDIFTFEHEWTMLLVKEHIIKPTIKTIFGYTSTTQLKRKDLDKLIDIVTLALAKREIETPAFPSKDSFN